MYRGNYADGGETPGADGNNTGFKVYGLGLQIGSRREAFNPMVEIAGKRKPEERLKPLRNRFSIVRKDIKINCGCGFHVVKLPKYAREIGRAHV